MIPGLLCRKKSEIPAHNQVRCERNLMRLIAAIGQMLVQHSECHAALGAGTLVDGRRHGAGTNLRNKIGKEVRGNDRQMVQDL